MENLHEECGVFGVYSNTSRDLALMVYYGLFALQHRGQESAGIVVNDDGVFTYAKGEGLVSEVFHADKLKSLGHGNIAVGHVRYATTGAKLLQNVQPLIVNHNKGRLALCHNGNLSNSYELRTMLEGKGAIFHTTTDSEVISYIIVQERLRQDSIEKAVAAAMDIIDGAYSLVISSPQKLIAARDPHGFRPLCYGKTEDGSIVFASESCALDAVGAKLERDLKPGEIAVVDQTGIHFDTGRCGKKDKHFCVFEYIYFARPDSVIDGTSVSLCRRNAGKFLAQQHPVDADIVIGVPDSGLEAAIGYSQESGIPYAIGFTKNKYIGRTFIAPEQSQRTEGVGIKLNPIREVVNGKRVVLIDDSIVRGTTCRHISNLLWNAGAKEIHMRVSAPPFIRPCYYGTDIDSADTLIANHMSVEEIAEEIGVTSLGYLSIENVKLLTGTDTGFCTACFDGIYPTKVPDGMVKNRFESKISCRIENP
ncbi:MAG: amidophosphoribosyltransferase [Lachnospiraceae bacterium]|nr:amidophosphoribosyltransferase [Lachnospiraceae bacterium]